LVGSIVEVLQFRSLEKGNGREERNLMLDLKRENRERTR